MKSCLINVSLLLCNPTVIALNTHWQRLTHTHICGTIMLIKVTFMSSDNTHVAAHVKKLNKM